MLSFHHRHTLIATMGLWLGVVAFAAHLLLSAEIGRRERDFDNQIQHLASEVRNKLDMNEAVLAGFAAFLQAVERNDIASATRYAASVTAAYPHIYMLEVARQVPLSEQAELQATLRREWLPGFTIKDFPWLTQRTLAGPSTQKFTWPILFMYPALPEAESIYGVRLETVDYLAHSLALAQKNTRPVASPLFQMYEGGTAYILLREVDRSERRDSTRGLNIFGTTMTALLLIKAESLLPSSPLGAKQPGFEYSAALLSANHDPSTLFTLSAEASEWPNRAFLPRLSRQLSIDNASQPTLMRFEQQLLWGELLSGETILIFALLACALVTVPTLILRHLKTLEHGEREHERSAYLATHDLLTGLPNRFLFSDRFEQSVQQHLRNGNAFSLLLLDLDHFKEINDRHGHEVGDEVLIEAARRMTHEIRACDTVARHGGDEFVILLANTLNLQDAQAVGEKLRAAIAAPVATSAGHLTLTCSIGVALYPAQGQTLDAIRKAADQAMYQAKAGGRNAVAAAG
ncbi:diguanylate cyclase domain-containing protein [Dechloromonas sp. ARDL1]|uniref:diguanylate cyclase domain-containing protein n=1 Tax=Dechloromonas sp. ARDL1 TaxID=3322121 RepID=UPI003DA77DAC